jgi:hypothetical protein
MQSSNGRRWPCPGAGRAVLAVLALGVTAAAQTSLPVTERWRATDARCVGVMLDLGPADDEAEVGYTFLGDLIVTKKLNRILGAYDVTFGRGHEVVAGAATSTPETSNRMTLAKFSATGQLLVRASDGSRLSPYSNRASARTR